MSDQQGTERGAAEENSGTPLTETERDASRQNRDTRDTFVKKR